MPAGKYRDCGRRTLGSIFFSVLTPILNTYTRTQEYEADMYGLNVSRQPDGFARAAIHLGEY
jgi:STE24 endopeptidase